MKPPKHKRGRKRRKSPERLKREGEARLEQRVKQQFADHGIQQGDKSDDIKMSVVFRAFVAPYYEYAEDQQALHRLLRIAMISWNIAFLPPQNQEIQIKSTLEGFPQDAREGARILMDRFVARKQEHFADIDRMLLDYDLTDLGDDYHLIVASTIDNLSAQGEP